MKKKILIGCMCAAAAIGFSSCSDFLTEKPQGVITGENFYNSQNDLDMAVYALMAQVQSYQCNTNPYLIDCQGDDVTSTVGSNKASYLAADGFSNPSDEKGVLGTWRTLYAIIKASNDIIMYAGATPTSQEEINIALGQAYFWRAYSYFGLVRNFGKLVLNLTNENDNNQAQLSSIEDVYAQIVSDLKTADALKLPVQYTTSPRSIEGANAYISAQAVKATLAAVYLHMAGYPLKKTEHYADAANYAKQVIDGVNNGTYPQSVQPWPQVYNYGNNFNDGCILGIYYSYAQQGWWSNSDSQNCNSHQNGKLFSGWGDFLPERKFWAEYPDGIRKQYVFAERICLDPNIFPTEDGSYISVSWWATKDKQPIAADRSNEVVPGYQPMYIGFTVNTGDAQTQPFNCDLPSYGGMCLPKTHQLLRYSEVLCWYAEAVARGGSSDVAGARAALKQVYAAAYAGDDAKINSVDALSGEALATAAFKEHGWEVAGNALGMVTRRSDLFRMEMLKQTWEYRHNNQTTVLVPAGTLTYSAESYTVGEKVYWRPVTYNLAQDLVINENFGPDEVAPTWRDENSIYQMYPSAEVAKNPALVR